jgi:hypothetical protein
MSKALPKYHRINPLLLPIDNVNIICTATLQRLRTNIVLVVAVVTLFQGNQGDMRRLIQPTASSEDSQWQLKTKPPTTRPWHEPELHQTLSTDNGGPGTSVFSLLDRTTGGYEARITWYVAVMARTISRSRPSDGQMWPSAPGWQSCKE